MVLPPELIDHIFSFLQKDTLALESCSKAHPLFSRLAERHLYAHIIVTNSKICHLILKNPRLLNYPRTLEIGGHVLLLPNPLAMSIMLMIPRMANLVSLQINNPHPSARQKEEFSSALGNCLQQSSFQQLSVSFLYDLPVSVLDDAKNIKHLTLSDCTADRRKPIPSSPSQVSLETLILSGYLNQVLYRWATRWVTRLTTLKLIVGDTWMDHNWTVSPELLKACSNSLTCFCLDMSGQRYSDEFPSSLAALKHLNRISISAGITRNQWALPKIIRLVSTAPATPNVVLRFHCRSGSVTSLSQLDWSLLNQLQSDFTGKRRIDLCVTGESIAGTIFCPEDILDALAANEGLKDLVKRSLVILKSEDSIPECL